MKCKVFEMAEVGHVRAERRINEWLETAGDVRIIATETVAAAAHVAWFAKLVVFYEEVRSPGSAQGHGLGTGGGRG